MSRTADLTIVYKGGADSSNRSTTITGVDVTSIYNAGQASGSTVNTYPVVFDVVFSDGGSYSRTEQVTVECKEIYNQGASSVSNYRYIYNVNNTGNVALRETMSTSSSSNVIGRLYSNTRVTYVGTYDNGNWIKVTYDGHTGYIVGTFVHTTPKANTSVVTTGWYAAPNVLYRVPNGAEINVGAAGTMYATANYNYEWIPVAYTTGGTTYKGFMQSVFVMGTNAQKGYSDIQSGCKNGITNASLLVLTGTTSVTTSGTYVNLRSTPNTL